MQIFWLWSEQTQWQYQVILDIENLGIFLKPREASCFSLILAEKQTGEHDVTVWLSPY